jgi:hypothetical protein
MIVDLKLPYGVAGDGRLVQVAQVERGLACGCRCPGCNRRLVAKKGDILRHHFAHESAVRCVGAFEAMVRGLTRQAIADQGYVNVPALIARFGDLTRTEVDQRRINVTDVRLIEDEVLARFGDRELAIQPYVTNRYPSERSPQLIARGLATFEINLSAFSNGEIDDSFEQQVLEDAPRFWLFNPRQKAANARLAASIEATRESNRQLYSAAYEAQQEVERHMIERSKGSKRDN